ncbi:MAG TPA: formate dehydrogenase accessory protein FdhE [Caulobacteraceae bacterium]|nr:formate dehydrogenase accessory protein FdhE [Caulobacteraceae bacterium]
MSDPRSTAPDPSMIGGVSKAPFVRLPEPASLFARRAARLQALATGDLAPYLAFLAELAQAQAAILPTLAEPQLPAPDVLARARAFAMPPLDRSAFASDAAAREACRRLFDALGDAAKPPAAEAALTRLQGANDRELDQMIEACLANAIAPDDLAAHVLTATGLQVHFARLAALVDAATLAPVGVGACPVCGGAPVASMVVGWPGAEGARYAACSMCGTLWNEVRVKCLVCGSTKGVGLQEVEGQGGTAKAETCDECHSYVKVLYQDKDAAIEPLADDVASLGLDQLMDGGEYRRAGVNPFLAGY